jgi:hypothetical protein
LVNCSKASSHKNTVFYNLRVYSGKNLHALRKCEKNIHDEC